MLDNSIQNNNCNPDKLPLGQLKLALAASGGVKRDVPALDAHWIMRDQNKPFHSYLCMLSSFGRFKTGSELDEWLYMAMCCQQDMEFLLGLSHHEFWSYMLYEESAMSAVITFLQRANPYYHKHTSLSADDVDAVKKALALYAQLLNLVVRIIMRLLTSQESASEWIEKQHHSKLLYSNYLMSVPMLFDLAIAVGDGDAQNVATLEKIFAAVLHIQPQYMKDLREGITFYENAFLSMQIQVENEGCEGAGGGALLNNDAETPYDDVVLFALDCAYTLRVLLSVCPAMTAICGQVKLVQCIANFYDLTVPMLYKHICLINPQANSLYWLNEARQQFLTAVRKVLSALLESARRDPQGGSAQSLVELLQECLSAQTFVVDYQRQYPVEKDVQQLLRLCPSIKDYKVDFVVSGYQKTLSACQTSVMAEELSNSVSIESDEEDSGASPMSLPLDVPAPTPINGRDIDLEVSAVLDVLPDLGIGFIRRVLTRYDNSEQAIAAILDDNLPPDLAHRDRSELHIPADPQDQFQKRTGLQHFNVHDGDKYDVLTQDMPQCIIKLGKGLPGAARNAEQMLDDKQHIGELKERYQKYALVEDCTDADGAEYEDEYDDSYEALVEGQATPLRQQQHRQQQASLNSAYEAPNDDEDQQDERDGDSSDASDTNKPRDFCENPEMVRARYAARQQAKWGNRAPAAATASRDVVGATKGQGQSRDTQRNRNQKEAHKSTRANHNRKAGAAYKRNKGMLS